MGSVNAPDNSQYPTLSLNLESRFQKTTEWTSIPCWHQNTNNPSVNSNGMARSMWSNGPYYTACNVVHPELNYGGGEINQYHETNNSNSGIKRAISAFSLNNNTNTNPPSYKSCYVNNNYNGWIYSNHYPNHSQLVV